MEGEGKDNGIAVVEISISAVGLVNLDAVGVSDPQVVVFEKLSGSDWQELGRTEVVPNSLSPSFTESIRVPYRFSSVQFLRFSCFDSSDPNVPATQQRLIGEITVLLSELVTTRRIARPIFLPSGGAARGTLVLNAEESADSSSVAWIELSADHLDKKDLFGKSDPFFVVSRHVQDNEFVAVAKSEVVHKSLDPKWKGFEIPVQKLCKGNLDNVIKVEVFDWNRSGRNTLIGYFVTSVNSLLQGTTNRFTLLNPEVKAKKANYKGSGSVVFKGFALEKRYGFTDYIRGGCEINVSVAIDFTSSNGNPRFKDSLHHIGGKPNPYLQAIDIVCGVLGEYDDDQMFPVYGFGAKVPPTMDVSHCWALNGNDKSPSVKGVLGIREVYQRALNQVVLYGPTILAQVLERGFADAKHCTQEKQVYQVLLILTDGAVDDLEATVNAIVQYNELPISIIIIGIGNADFSKMRYLDADETPLVSTFGGVAIRDIVQFIPFNNFKDQPASVLAQAILEEIPGQMLSYFKTRGIVPNEPRDKGTVVAPQPPTLRVNDGYAKAMYAGGTQNTNANMFNRPQVILGQEARPTQASDVPSTAAPYTADLRSSWFM